jgi:2-polyprenyl-3-methyl-5-hydroxy-6-metoxy-1,4-benzoquinol methylase
MKRLFEEQINSLIFFGGSMVFKVWSDVSSDPNSSEVLSFRSDTLAKARVPLLKENRIAYLSQLVSGKNILDIGVVEHFEESSNSDLWLHQHICNAAKTCLGVDILEEMVILLRSRGYNVIAHDITRSALPMKFDVIIVGDVIEHLNNPGSLFEHAAQMLEPHGRLVISTPNPWYANAILKNLFEGKPFTDSADHCAWFDAGTICELASRNGLVLDRYAGIKAKQSTSRRSGLFVKLAPFLIRVGFRPEVFAKTMVYEFTFPVFEK